MIEQDLLELIRFACKRARQHNHDRHHSIGIHQWGYLFLHDKAVMYVRELVGVLKRYRVEKKNFTTDWELLRDKVDVYHDTSIALLTHQTFTEGEAYKEGMIRGNCIAYSTILHIMKEMEEGEL